MSKKYGFLILILLLTLLAAACAKTGPDPGASEPTVIEPGLETPAEPEEEPEEPAAAEPTDPFPDLGEAATVADLTAAQAKIASYYFEQTVQYPSGQIFMQVWYKDQRMKVVTSAGGVSQSEFYYDYGDMTVISFYPGVSQAAILADFDAASPDAPQNPKTTDYAGCKLLGVETVNRQTCLVLETPEGNKLWVGTKYGFPLQGEFVDSLGDQYTVAYKNIVINSVTDDEVALPAGLTIKDMTSSASPPKPEEPAATEPLPETDGEEIPQQ